MGQLHILFFTHVGTAYHLCAQAVRNILKTAVTPCLNGESEEGSLEFVRGDSNISDVLASIVRVEDDIMQSVCPLTKAFKTLNCTSISCIFCITMLMILQLW